MTTTSSTTIHHHHLQNQQQQQQQHLQQQQQQRKKFTKGFKVAAHVSILASFWPHFSSDTFQQDLINANANKRTQNAKVDLIHEIRVPLQMDKYVQIFRGKNIECFNYRYVPRIII